MGAAITHKATLFETVPWCANGHFHTIGASLLFKPARVNYKREKIETPDGDFLNLDLLEKPGSSSVVILLHGLEGSSRRYYIQNLAKQLYDDGHTVAALNFRSCGGNMNLKRRFYHSGETGDLATTCSWLAGKYPDSVQFAAGFSLGGSILLNYLKQYKERGSIIGFAAVSVPFDLHRGSVNLQKGFNKIYDYYFLRSLKSKLEQKRRLFSDMPVFTGSTVFEFDGQVTAPIHGFRDAADYYARCSSAFFMDQIATPGLLIHSKEDPLCPFEYTPVEAIENNPNLTSLFTDQGGHVGFWGQTAGWIEQAVSQHLKQLAEENSIQLASNK